MNKNDLIVESGKGIELSKMTFRIKREYKKALKEKRTYRDKHFLETLLIDEMLEVEDVRD